MVGALAVIAYSYLLGKPAGELILIKKQSSILVGTVAAILVLWASVITASVVGLLQEGDGSMHSITDYVGKPVALVSLAGILPAVLLGVGYGRWIKAKG